MRRILGCIILYLFLIGCATNGDSLRSNVYNENQINQAQECVAVTILNIIPAKIVIGNSKQKDIWSKVGTVGGAVSGGLSADVIGASFGAIAGNFVGFSVKDKIIITGVTIEFRNEQNGKILASTQVGKMCEYTINSKTLLITNGKETRVQPNGYCP